VPSSGAPGHQKGSNIPAFLFISHQLHTVFEGRIFSTPTLRVASRGSFCRSTTWLKGHVFVFILHQFHVILKGQIFFTPYLGVASGGTFGLWSELMPLPMSTRGLLHVLIGLEQIWVLQVAPFPLVCRSTPEACKA